MKYVKYYESKYNSNVRLYHILDFTKLKYVYETNSITSYKFQNISTTRNKLMFSYLGASAQSFIKLELDANKLSSKYKIETYQYKTNNSGFLKENEERIITRKIPNIDKYITSIIIDWNYIKSLLHSKIYHRPIAILTTESRYGNINTICEFLLKYTKELNVPLLFQVGTIISERSDLIDIMLNYKLYEPKYTYLNMYRGYEPVSGERFKYLDVLVDGNGNKIENFVIGSELETNDYVSIDSDSNPLSKEIDGIEYNLYRIKIEIINDIYILKDIRML